MNNYKFDYSISHLPVNKNNIRLPLWKMYIDWFDVKTYNNPEYLIPLDYIDNNNEFNFQKINFAQLFIHLNIFLEKII